MSTGWDALSAVELRAVAAAMRSGRLPAQPSAMALQAYCTPQQAQWLAAVLASMQVEPRTLATFFELLAGERARVDAVAGSVDLVWTGPEIGDMQNRDTGAVMRELFSSAQKSVLVAGYAIYQGREVFATLADRMAALPDLQVRLIVDIQRDEDDRASSIDLAIRYALNFRSRNWPGERLPEVFYDPRSLELERGAKRSSMHAKVVVVDQQVALITSANFTEAAQTRNIEVGALVRDPRVAQQLAAHFEALLSHGFFKKLVF